MKITQFDNIQNIQDILYHKIDEKLSKEFCDNYNYIIKTSECYSNIAHITLNFEEKSIDYNSIKIIFGAAQLFDDKKSGNRGSIFYKHCYFLINNKVVDPTLYKIGKLNESNKYFSIVEYDLKDYLDMLRQEEHTCPRFIEKIMFQVTQTLAKLNILYLI